VVEVLLHSCGICRKDGSSSRGETTSVLSHDTIRVSVTDSGKIPHYLFNIALMVEIHGLPAVSHEFKSQKSQLW